MRPSRTHPHDGSEMLRVCDGLWVNMALYAQLPSRHPSHEHAARMRPHSSQHNYIMLNENLADGGLEAPSCRVWYGKDREGPHYDLIAASASL